jgi:tRNA (guanine37-N1)-methyltransferase
MKIDIITLFPDYFHQSLAQSLVGKAGEKQLFDIGILNLRDFATDKHRTTDEPPYGGGGGMVLKIEPLDKALQSLGYAPGQTRSDQPGRILLTSAAGKKFDQPTAIQFSMEERLTIICGHYLGVDERLLELYEIDEISIGDYVLTGGEPAALVMIDAVVRLIPKVLGNFESALSDSFMNHLLGAPCYTRPPDYEGLQVPEPLLSGDHAEIKKERMKQELRRCQERRPDLLARADLSDIELELLKQIDREKKERI